MIYRGRGPLAVLLIAAALNPGSAPGMSVNFAGNLQGCFMVS